MKNFVTKTVASAIGLIALAASPNAQQQAVPLEQQKVSRLPPLPQPLDPIMRAMFDKRRAQGGSIINLQLVTGHAPKFAQAASTMAFTIRFDAKTPRKLIELIIMRTAQIVGSRYEINQHIPLSKMCGYSDAQIAALPNWKTSTLFDDRERVLLGYVEEMAHGGDVDDSSFAALQKYFDPQEIVEITYTIGSYYANGLLTKALRIEVENDGRETVTGNC
ncbi:MAG TPA: carboxymuconolactone decarboxylase family protein [Xanthobacteraceae bacterium]